MARKELVPYSRTYADYVKDAGRCEEFLKTWMTGVTAGLNEVDEETAKKVLKKSGEDCCKIFLELYGYDLGGRDLDSLIDLLDSDPGAGSWKENDNTVIYEFKPERCECTLVEKKMIELTPRLCSACFTNWLEYMFGTVTKRTVKAELIESLATGASKCAFRIRLV